MTVMRGRKDDGQWTETDRMMALGLTAFEASICPGCGLPAAHGMGDDNVGRYGVEETICHGCEARESATQDIKDPYPGMKLVLVEG